MLRRHFVLAVSVVVAASTVHAGELPGTKPLTATGDIAAQMVAGINRYLERELLAASKAGKDRWVIDSSTPAKLEASLLPHRNRLKKIIGLEDIRHKAIDLEYVATDRMPALVAETPSYKVYAVRWPVFDNVFGEGLLLEPNVAPKAAAVAIPDADQSPEMLAGLSGGVIEESQFARRLAESGVRVIVPVLIDRGDIWSSSVRFNRRTNQTHREFIYRMAYEMGRHIIGYEVQRVLAAVDWLKSKGDVPVGAYGYCEGGVIALYAGAVDPRIRATVVSGFAYDDRHNVWTEPIYRNIWSLLPEFRDEHLRNLFADGRSLIYEHSTPAKVDGPPALKSGQREAAPGKLVTPAEVAKAIAQVTNEAKPHVRAEGGGGDGIRYDWRVVTPFEGRFGNPTVLEYFLAQLGVSKLAPLGKAPTDKRKDFTGAARHKRQFDELVAHTQKLWRDSDFRRRDFWSRANPVNPEHWEKTTEWYRDYFWEEVIGKLPAATLDANPRTREIYNTPKWIGYEVMLDLYPDVFAYGYLLMPKDLKPGEKRPVVVCQHGLEGRPRDVANPDERTKYYNSFAAQLCDMGYIVYAPQNPYIGMDNFRVIQRKGHPLKTSLFSFIVRQHETTLNWLATLPNVDKDNIGFYGLSYGGKTAMRVPAILKQYKLSICSADFNEWVGKNVSIDFRGSYMWTIEYDMYEFDLGHTYNYAEMAFLIAPRPFMVERGHDDGVGIDEMVAYEYAKIRYLYANKLRIPERTTIEFFAGGHEINLKGTAEFLKKHLGWPR